MSIFNELKRRNVLRVAAGYVVLAWLVVQVVETIFPAFGFGDESIRFVVIAFAVGFIPVVVLAWVFEWTPDGLKKDSDAGSRGPVVTAAVRRWDRIVMAILAVAVVYFIAEKVIEKLEVEPTIAVLPFIDRSVGTGQAYMSDGVSEGVLDLLARIPELWVTARSASFSFRNQEIGIPEIAKQLDVNYILEGSVGRSGDALRISAQLIEVDSQRVLWSNTYDRMLGDIFAIQDEIAADVVDNLRVELLGELPRAHRTSTEVFRLTLQAKAQHHLRTSESLRLAKSLFDEALALDPNYVPALQARIMTDHYLNVDGLITPEEGQRRWETAQERILAISPDDGVINAYLAYQSVFEDRDFAQAARQIRTALANAPNHYEALRTVGGIARRTGHAEAAVGLHERAYQLDPLCSSCLWNLSESYLAAGMLDEALAAKIKLRALNQGGAYHYGLIRLLTGEPEVALEAFDSMIKAGRNTVQGLAGRARAMYDLGNLKEFNAILAELESDWGDEEPGLVAAVYAWTGQFDEAYLWLEKYFDQDEDQLRHQFFDPNFWNLVDDPRWTELRERADMSAEQTAILDFSPFSEAKR
jgi:adenylate cyclase